MEPKRLDLEDPPSRVSRLGRRRLSDLAGSYLEVFHEHSDNDVDEDKLSDEDEDDEEHWRHHATDAAVVNAVVRRVAVLS